MNRGTCPPPCFKGELEGVKKLVRNQKGNPAISEAVCGEYVILLWFCYEFFCSFNIKKGDIMNIKYVGPKDFRGEKRISCCIDPSLLIPFLSFLEEIFTVYERIFLSPNIHLSDINDCDQENIVYLEFPLKCLGTSQEAAENKIESAIRKFVQEMNIAIDL